VAVSIVYFVPPLLTKEFRSRVNAGLTPALTLLRAPPRQQRPDSEPCRITNGEYTDGSTANRPTTT
jgi:hypothetical protein